MEEERLRRQRRRQQQQQRKCRLLVLALCQRPKGGREQVSLMSLIFTWLYVSYTRDARGGKVKRAASKLDQCRSMCGAFNRVIEVELPHVWMHMCSQRFPLWPLVPIGDYDGRGWFNEFSARWAYVQEYTGTKKIVSTHRKILSGGVLGGKRVLLKKLARMRNAENVYSDHQRLRDTVGNEIFEWLLGLATGITGGERVALKFAVSMIKTDSFYLPGTEKTMCDLVCQNTRHRLYYFAPQTGGSTPAILLYYYNEERRQVMTIAFNISYCTQKNDIEMICPASRRALPEGLGFRDKRGNGYSFGTLKEIGEFVEARGVLGTSLVLRKFKVQDA